VATLTTARAAVAPARHSEYRPHLDGLRAIAVLLVVAFHSQIAKFSGGFVGVDVFFVLSGYLVTQLLLRDIGSFERIRLRRFYARRYRRLLPAAFVALVVSSAAFVLVASAAEVSDSKGAFRAAFLYFANWHFIRQGSDYFAADINRSPVIHFWSLAVEEQFYLLWPLLLGGLFAATRKMTAHRVAVIRGVVALGALVSVIAALHISRTNLNRAYYGTDTRAYQLLAGALLALTPRLFRLGERVRRGLEIAAVAGVVAIIVLATSAISLETIHRGVAITIATCALIIAIEKRTDERGRQGVVATAGRVSRATVVRDLPLALAGHLPADAQDLARARRRFRGHVHRRDRVGSDQLSLRRVRDPPLAATRPLPDADHRGGTDGQHPGRARRRAVDPRHEARVGAQGQRLRFHIPRLAYRARRGTGGARLHARRHRVVHDRPPHRRPHPAAR
jgi:peptidoglycan/LPS O-acetylase OafA/YrhL